MVLGLMLRLEGISVVLPALNEEANVERAVARARTAAARSSEHVEVIVVDDGSTDATADVARRTGARVVSHGKNRGYGAALRSGFAAARQPWIFQMDCDNQFDPEEIGKLVPFTCHDKVIVGIRTARADNWMRRAAGRAWNQLCRLAFGRLVSDVDCGFKLLDRAAIESLDLRSDGAGISLELCIAAKRAGYGIAEVSVGHHPRVIGAPTGLRPRVVLRGLRELYDMRRRFGSPRRWK
jgi:glycosyltransferase involved in cell wall biosynthesis